MTEKERQDTKMATLYELRLLFTQGEKKEYTTEEIVELIDKIATAKEQQRDGARGPGDLGLRGPERSVDIELSELSSPGLGSKIKRSDALSITPFYL